MQTGQAIVGALIFPVGFPAALGNIVGGFTFTALALYLTSGNRDARDESAAVERSAQT